MKLTILLSFIFSILLFVAPGSAAPSRSCGGKLVTFVLSVCGSECPPEADTKMLTETCSQGVVVDSETVKQICCPTN